MRLIIVATLAIFLSGCAFGISSLQTATDQQLFSDLKKGALWVPPGHHDAVRQELKDRHPEYNWAAIDQRKIVTGMTKEECILSWGFPYRVNHASYGEQWVYNQGAMYYHGRYLYFTGNTCTAFN